MLVVDLLTAIIALLACCVFGRKVVFFFMEKNLTL